MIGAQLPFSRPTSSGRYLRGGHAGRVAFATLCFPTPSHRNSERAAVAVETATQPHRFEEMYDRMAQTQARWAEREDAKGDVVFGFAQEIGLNMWQCDPGVALNMQGTPTIFVNSEATQLEQVEDVWTALDAALAS